MLTALEQPQGMTDQATSASVRRIGGSLPRRFTNSSRAMRWISDSNSMKASSAISQSRAERRVDEGGQCFAGDQELDRPCSVVPEKATLARSGINRPSPSLKRMLVAGIFSDTATTGGRHAGPAPDDPGQLITYKIVSFFSINCL